MRCKSSLSQSDDNKADGLAATEIRFTSSQTNVHFQMKF
jgi:hypothetical protein